MPVHPITPARPAALLLLAGALLVPSPAEAQGGLLGRVKRKAQEVVRPQPAAAPTPDPSPAAGASAATPAADSAAPARPLRPGEGAWANYDFKPGERILFADDFTADAVGNFPRRLEFDGGNMEIVEWNGGRWLSAGGAGDFILPLPEVLPERFTLEFDLIGYGNATEVFFTDPEGYHGERLAFFGERGGIRGGDRQALGEGRGNMAEDVISVRVMADGPYVKVFMNESRVANVPNSSLGRSSRIWFRLNGWSAESPRMLANLRVAAVGRTLYDAIAAEGRVATQGIYFDFNSDRIRPESTPTLKEIGAMLAQHPDLALTIEGHTDAVGAAAANQALSERRAAAVKAALVEMFSVDGSRLAAVGLGATVPAATNDTPEGRQQNRRVELARREG